MLTLKVLSLLLRYPTSEIREALPELVRALDEEEVLPQAARRELGELIDELAGASLLEAQERYGELFDRGRKLSLHVFEHSHGESRERGPAMVELLRHYQSCGFTLAARELPDYLPLVLEFLAERPEEEVIEMLGEAMPVIVMLEARLRGRGSRYASVLAALQAIAGEGEDAEALRRQVATEGPDEALVDMDKIWEEEAVTFMQEDPAKEQAGEPVHFYPRRAAGN